MRKRFVIPIIVAAVLIALAAAIPAVTAKYVGRSADFDVTVHAPEVYFASQTVPINSSGYYYLEAWGGDGGVGRGGREGGYPQRISGLYYLSAGTVLHVQVGTAGESTSASGAGTTPPAGGTNGSVFGAGGAGGYGGTGGGGDGGKGGAGGAGSLVFVGNTLVGGNILLASGGGGGGGGSADAAFGSYTPGLGGGGGLANNQGSNGVNAGGNQGGAGGSALASNSYGTGNAGGAGGNGSGLYHSGAGGGGGGGGWTNGGSGGYGGGRSQLFDVAGGGGGGKGGSSFVASSAISGSGFSLPFNARPNNNHNGAVILTFIQ